MSTINERTENRIKERADVISILLHLKVTASDKVDYALDEAKWERLTDLICSLVRVRSIGEWADEINSWAKEKGWDKDLVLSTMIANCHTELSEAWEEIRNGHAPNEVYFNGNSSKPEGFPVELADLVIRVLHICAVYDLDMDKLIEQKMKYNWTRPYRHGRKTA